MKKSSVVLGVLFLVGSLIVTSPVKAQKTEGNVEQAVPNQGLPEEILGSYKGLMIPGQATNPRFTAEMIISNISGDTLTVSYLRDNVIVRNKEVVKTTRKSEDVISLDFKQGSYDMIIATLNLKTKVMHLSTLVGRGFPSEGDMEKKK